MNKHWYVLIAVVIGMTAGFYFLVHTDAQEEHHHSVIHVGVLPDENMEQLNFRYAPLFSYLSEHTGLEYRHFRPTLDSLEKDGLIAIRSNSVHCSEKGYQFLDDILQTMLP